MEMSVRKAREFGIGLTLVRRTNNLGFLAFYTMRAASQGFVGLTMGNANAAISRGAARKLLRNQPDLHRGSRSESLWARHVVEPGGPRKIRRAQRLGEKIPLGWRWMSRARHRRPWCGAQGTLLPIEDQKGTGWRSCGRPRRNAVGCGVRREIRVSTSSPDRPRSARWHSRSTSSASCRSRSSGLMNGYADSIRDSRKQRNVPDLSARRDRGRERASERGARNRVETASIEL